MRHGEHMSPIMSQSKQVKNGMHPQYKLLKAELSKRVPKSFISRWADLEHSPRSKHIQHHTQDLSSDEVF